MEDYKQQMVNWSPDEQLQEGESLLVEVRPEALGQKIWEFGESHDSPESKESERKLIRE
jgi:hypothetical protein